MSNYEKLSDETKTLVDKDEKVVNTTVNTEETKPKTLETSAPKLTEISVPKTSESESKQNTTHVSAQEVVSQLKQELKKFRESNEKRRVILLGVDSSKNSVHAVKWCAERVFNKTDVIILFTVWEESMNFSTFVQPDPLVPIIIDPAEIWKNNALHLKQARKLLHSIYEEYLKGFEVINLLVSSGTNNVQNIGSLIVDSANQFEVDCVVVGSRGLGVLGQFFLGSVSKYVVENSKCPVLVIKDTQ